MAALVIDGGSWWRAQRHLQTSADAAALAGAQDLPDQLRPAQRRSTTHSATTHLAAPAVTFPRPEWIDVRATTTAPGVFAKVVSAAFTA